MYLCSDVHEKFRITGPQKSIQKSTTSAAVLFTDVISQPNLHYKCFASLCLLLCCTKGPICVIILISSHSIFISFLYVGTK